MSLMATGMPCNGPRRLRIGQRACVLRDGDWSKRAIACLGKAGSITVHHVRAVHGSATNHSGRARRFLLYQYRAADAWPLLGLKEGIEKFNEQLLVGEPSLYPRLAPLPVRMPLPPAEHQGSIYENQRATGRRYFDPAIAERAIAAE